ncbi:hypothetical protein K438DRAFT_1763074 [Mycena galopus ATCC 62051]|nr:hypothetical protein K438DRAFT_1763074 [Mycena galopus ATCC 62051]
MADTPTSALQNNRRRRAYVACTQCRRLKIKCVLAGEPPQRPCVRCTKRGFDCVAVDEPTTPQSPSRPPASPSYSNVQEFCRSPGVPRPEGYMTPSASSPSQPQYPSWWNPLPQSQSLYPGPGRSQFVTSSSRISQNLYGGSQGYPPQYSMPQQFVTPTPTNQWPQGLQGSMPQQPRQVLPQEKMQDVFALPVHAIAAVDDPLALEGGKISSLLQSVVVPALLTGDRSGDDENSGHHFLSALTRDPSGWYDVTPQFAGSPPINDYALTRDASGWYSVTPKITESSPTNQEAVPELRQGLPRIAQYLPDGFFRCVCAAGRCHCDGDNPPSQRSSGPYAESQQVPEGGNISSSLQSTVVPALLASNCFVDRENFEQTKPGTFFIYYPFDQGSPVSPLPHGSFTQNDLACVEANAGIEEGLMSVYEPADVVLWIEDNWDHPLIISIQNRGWGGPFAWMLSHQEPSLAIFGPYEDPMILNVAQSLADFAGFPVIIRPASDDPTLTLLARDNESQDGYVQFNTSDGNNQEAEGRGYLNDHDPPEVRGTSREPSDRRGRDNNINDAEDTKDISNARAKHRLNHNGERRNYESEFVNSLQSVPVVVPFKFKSKRVNTGKSVLFPGYSPSLGTYPYFLTTVLTFLLKPFLIAVHATVKLSHCTQFTTFMRHCCEPQGSEFPDHSVQNHPSAEFQRDGPGCPVDAIPTLCLLLLTTTSMASPSGWASSPSSSGLILACFVTDSMFVSAADSHVAALADFYVATRRLFSNSFLS